MSSLVSVVVPIYDSEAYLRDCLDSLVNQTYTDLDIVLIDDGSNDSSLQMAREYASRDERIFILIQNNSGQSIARNNGLEFIKGSKLRSFVEERARSTSALPLAHPPLPDSCDDIPQGLIDNLVVTHEREVCLRGDPVRSFYRQRLPSDRYIHFLDSDDFLSLGCIEACMREVRDNCNIEIVWHGVKLYYHGVKRRYRGPDHVYNCFYRVMVPITRGLTITGEEYYEGENLLGFDFVWMVHGIFRASLLNLCDLRFLDGIECEDHAFGSMLLSQASCIKVIDHLGYFYRIRPDSTCNYTKKKDISLPVFVNARMDDFKFLFKNKRDVRSYFHLYSFAVTAVYVHQNVKLRRDLRVMLERKYGQKVIMEVDPLADPLKLLDMLSPLVRDFNLVCKIKCRHRLFYAYFFHYVVIFLQFVYKNYLYRVRPRLVRLARWSFGVAVACSMFVIRKSLRLTRIMARLLVRSVGLRH